MFDFEKEENVITQVLLHANLKSRRNKYVIIEAQKLSIRDTSYAAKRCS